LGLDVVVGGFFGDEGKGKTVAYISLAYKPKLMVRTGSVNAGHTVVYRGKRYKLRLVPSGFIYPGAGLRIAAGALIRLDVFWEETRRLGVLDRIKVDANAGVIEEKHVEAERRDALLSGKIGSTLQGVGAAMADRVLRRLRLARDFPELKPYLADVALEVNEAIERGDYVLVEGCQGVFLSLYHGTYPYVTSRDTTASGVLSEVGVGPKKVSNIIIVFKSYVTRVGGGPLPGELSVEEAKRLGLIEYGTVTGRPRRIAPFNLQLARRAVMLNSATEAALTKIDKLFPQAKCVREWDRLPREVRQWIEDIEDKIRIPVTLISTGEEVECMVDRRREVGVI